MKIYRSFKNALKGLVALFFSQTNARIHGVAALLVILSGFVFKIDAWEWCMVILCIGSVIAAEAINTAIEMVADIAQPMQDERVRRLKDISAGAVLIVSAAAAVIGSIIFIPKIMVVFHHFISAP